MKWTWLWVWVAAPGLAAADPCEPADSTPSIVRADATGVTACYPNSCWRFDLASKRWAAASARPATPSDPPEDATQAVSTEQTTAATRLHVCLEGRGRACHDLVAPSEPGAAVVANGDRSLFAVRTSGSSVDVFDGTTDQRTATITAWPNPADPVDPVWFRSATFANNTLVVFENNSAVSASGRLYNGHTGALIGKVGTVVELDDWMTPIDGDYWMFRDLDGERLFIQNVKTGAIAHTISLAAPNPVPTGVGPGPIFAQVSADHSQILAMRGDPKSGLTVYATKSGSQSRYPLPAVCK